MSTGRSTRVGILAVFLLLRIASGFAVEAFVPMHAAKLIAAAEKGDPECQYRLAQHYEFGDGPYTQNGPVALLWYRKAAESGYTAAEAQIGEMYAQLEEFRGGWYPYRDLATGVQWLKKAAVKGHARSQYLLAKAFRLGGDGVIKDDAEHLRWLRKAAEKDYEAASQLSSLYGEGVLVPKSTTDASLWNQKTQVLRELEKREDADLKRKGRLYLWDLDRAEATLSLNYYLLEAGRGNAQAQYVLGRFVFVGEGPQRNLTEAYKWSLLAVNQAHTRAQQWLPNLEKQLSATERTEGQRRARSFVVKK